MKVCVTLPVYNEQEQLESSALKVLEICKKNYKDFEILIADNASTDATLDIAKKLSKEYKQIKYIHLPQKGRGRALKTAWQSTDADIMCYMDIDLSTDLKHLKELTDAIEKGYDISFGSRHLKESELERSFKRDVLSKGYNFLLKLFLNVDFKDAQCGFKAINKKVATELLPKISDNEWFFDTELLVKGQRFGYKLKEIPVKWTEDKGSTVKIWKTVSNYMKNIFRLRKELKQ
ncbi:MAG: glycosyltransferase family 2 protein [Candidatus Aenigmarchaeota archaeon]|nr:glycosyltransferase family 2 protein [Candidatus Aenigmarchaeota archaeon]